MTISAAIRRAEHIWSSEELPEELAIDGRAKRAELSRIADQHGLHAHLHLLHEAMLLATERLLHARTFPRPAFTRRALKQQAINLERALRVMEARHDKWPVAPNAGATAHQVFGNDPVPMTVWQLRGGLRHELQRIEAELAQKRVSRLRRDDLRAAAEPLRTFWVTVAGGNHAISSKGGRLSKTGKFLFATLRLIDPTVTERLIADLDK